MAESWSSKYFWSSSDKVLKNSVSKKHLNFANLSNNSFSESLNSGGLFDELYSDDLALAQKLEQLTYKYKGHDNKCQLIEDEVRKTIKKVVLLSPTEEEILAELQSGKLSAHVNIVYENFADHFRASISDQFEEINKSVVASGSITLDNPEHYELPKLDYSWLADNIASSTFSQKLKSSSHFQIYKSILLVESVTSRYLLLYSLLYELKKKSIQDGYLY